MPEEMTSVEVRSKLVEALRLDLVGPGVNLGDRAGGATASSLTLVPDGLPGSARGEARTEKGRSCR